MSDSLARQIGERVQFYRQASRRTKAVVAGLAGITPDYLYQIERGQKVPTIAVLTLLAEVLRVPVGQLIGKEAEPDVRPSRTAAGEVLCRALTSPIERSARPVDPAELRRRVEDAWRTWQMSPHRYSHLTACLPALIVDVETTMRAVRAHPDSPVQLCASDLYCLLRTVAKRVGRLDLSLLAADRALRYAEESADALRTAAAQWNMAQVLLAGETPEAAQDLAAEAAAGLQPLQHGGDARANALCGALMLVEAIAAARNNDPWTARERIRQAAPLAASTGECNALWTAFGPTNVAMYAVGVEIEAGEAVEGLRIAEGVDLGRSPSIERRVAFLIDQAKGYEQRRDLPRALALIAAVERQAPEDLRYRSSAHTVLRSVVQRGRGSVATQASQLALRIGLPV
ncbi:helix-turn-helix domain-containing protein [Nocardia shimofusensis]|uniref:helix-turn-helix domain-containing protein n=1 Tax=Nocardia shimofusensis TaxID=228596 RepID=UPI000832C96F|nr:helix-turn-helix transcriptional regulator [Nocardia shimofusensis]